MFNSKMIGTNNAAGGGGGGIAFVNTDVDFRSLDVSDPSNISQLSSITIATGLTQYAGGGIAIDRDNNVAYTVNSGTTLTAIDISDPSNLSILDTLVFGVRLTDVVIDPTTSVVYVSDRQGGGAAGIYSIDISNPSNMSILDSHNGGVYYTDNLVDLDIDIVNKRLVAANQAGYCVVTFDISNPSSIENISFRNYGRAPASVKFSADGANIYGTTEIASLLLTANPLSTSADNNFQTYLYYPDAPLEISENLGLWFAAGRGTNGYLSAFSLFSNLRHAETGFYDVMGIAIDNTNNILYTSGLGGIIKVVQLNAYNDWTVINTHTLTSATNTKRIALY